MFRWPAGRRAAGRITLFGTLEVVAIASVIALPIGIFTAIYLVQYGRDRFAKAVTFFVDVMTGVPSVQRRGAPVGD